MHCHAHPGNETKHQKPKKQKPNNKTPNTKTTQAHKTRNKQPKTTCEKRKPTYTSCVLKSTLSLSSLRQTQTPTVVAAPQLLTSLQCQIKELVPPRLLSARQTPSFLSRRHTQRNRSTRTRAGTRPQPTNKERKQDVPVWLLFQVP